MGSPDTGTPGPGKQPKAPANPWGFSMSKRHLSRLSLGFLHMENYNSPLNTHQTKPPDQIHHPNSRANTPTYLNPIRPAFQQIQKLPRKTPKQQPHPHPKIRNAKNSRKHFQNPPHHQKPQQTKKLQTRRHRGIHTSHIERTQHPHTPQSPITHKGQKDSHSRKAYTRRGIKRGP